MSCDPLKDTIARFPQTPAQVPLPLTPAEGERAEFPIAALGVDMAAAVNAIVEIAQCPPALAGQSVLAASAFCVQGHVDVRHPMGEARPCSLLLMTLAESGERKSTADKLALEGVRKAECDGENAYQRAHNNWKVTCEANDAARKAVTRGKAKDPSTIRAALANIPANPDAPLSPKRIVADANYEGLLKHMQNGHGSLAWFNNEAGQAIGGTAMHDDNRLKFSAGLSLLWDGQSIDHVRAGSGAVTHRGRRLTTHLMCQPDIARPFLSDPVLRAQGWLSRALICEPSSMIGERLFRPCSPQAGAGLERFHKRTCELIKTPCPCGDKPNELTPGVLELSKAALAVWIAFHDATEASLGDGGRLNELRGFGAKLAENVLRIAGVLAHFEGAGEIAELHMRRASELGAYYAAEALRVFDLANVSSQMLHAERVRRWLMRRTEDVVTVNEANQLGPRPRGKAVVESAFAILEEHGWLAREGANWRILGRD